MSTEILVVVGILVVSFAAGYFFWYLPRQRSLKEEAQRGCPVTHAPITARDICIPLVWGGQIDRHDGGACVIEDMAGITDEVRALVSNRVVSGLSRMLAASRRDYPSWTNMMNTSQYVVCFIKKMATNMDGTPALVVSGYQTAGTISNVFPDGGRRGFQQIILPIPDDWLAENYAPYLEASAYNEGEHVVEYNNDFGLFLQYVGSNDVHPHRAPISELLDGAGLQDTCSITFGYGHDAARIVAGNRTVEK